ncbi:MAG: DNA double-strand break repair nuclease NurA [Thermofilum sp.]
MALLQRSGYLDSDVKMLVEKLAEIYRQGGKPVQLTLTGEPARPHPVLKLGGLTIRGPPVSETRFRAIEEVPHNFTVFAVDAAARLLFDAGPYKIVSAKVVAGVWRGLERLRIIGPVKRIALFESLQDAGDWLAAVELEAAYRFARENPGAFFLMDRPLAAPAASRARRALKALTERSWRVIGLPKSTSVKVSTGEGLAGYLSKLAGRVLAGLPWVYYPVVEQPKLGLAVAAVKLASSGPVFRLDLTWRMAESYDVADVAGMLAYLQDFSSPGYPLPLKIVHELSRISGDELEMDRALFLEEVSLTGVARSLLEDAAGSEFKTRYLWGGLS